MDLIREIGLFLWAVINNWAGYATGGFIVALIWLYFSGLRNKPVPRILTLCLAGFFLIMAFFKAWEDQYKKAQSATVYVETHIAPVYNSNTPTPSFFALHGPITARFLWTRTGQDLALNVNGVAKVYVESNTSMETQKRITEDAENELKRKMSYAADIHAEGATLGFTPESATIFTTPPLSVYLDDNLFASLWDGSKVAFFVSTVHYEDRAGNQYESHYCNYLQPLKLSYILAGGQYPKIPEPPQSVLTTFNVCETFNGMVKVNQ